MEPKLPYQKAGRIPEWYHENYNRLRETHSHTSPSCTLRNCPAKLRRNYVTNKISHHAWVNKEHPLQSLVPDPQSLRPQPLKSRHPFYRHAAEHHNCDHDIVEAWNEEWTKHQRPKQLAITPDATAPPGSDLPWKLWVILNRLRAGVGRFGAEMHKWGLRTSASCACGAATQNAKHILFDCNLLRPPNMVKNLTNVTDDTKNWLQHLAEKPSNERRRRPLR